MKSSRQTYQRLVIAIGCFLPLSCGVAQDQAAETKVVLASEVDWEQLNPKRGDASPKAATLWGDRNGTVATGFLVKFVDGFSSPPHIHNVTYRGVVIAGLVHNDDPDAKEMWMPPGSYWTQPAGEVHITSAKGRETVAYIEIEKGPYLVLPTEQAFDRGERPVNVDPSNIVWLDASGTSWIAEPSSTGAAKPQISFLWGKPIQDQMNGTLIKLPPGFTGKIQTASTFKTVLIRGKAKLHMTDGPQTKTLTPGSYLSSQGKAEHHFSCETAEGCVFYVRNKGTLKVVAGS